MENEVNILAEEKPKTIKLADGKEYTLPPIDLTTLANIEKTIGFGLNKVKIEMDDEPLQTLRLIAYALLKENQLELTIEQAGRLITINEFKKLSEIISIIMAISS